MKDDATLSHRVHNALHDTLRNGALAYIQHEGVRNGVLGLLRINGLDRATELRAVLRNAQAMHAAGHWSASINRIIGLKQALIGERWLRRFGKENDHV